MREKKVKNVVASVIENKNICGDYYLLKIDCPEISSCVCPGQFIHVRVSERLDILLRRPFSVFDVDGSYIHVLYEIVGKGTKILSDVEPGYSIDVLGPLGNGFNLNIKNSDIVFVAGGIGIAPLLFLAKQMEKYEKKIKLFFGVDTAEKLRVVKYFADYTEQQFISTDDGTEGYRGRITDLIDGKISEIKDSYMYVCGPNIMMQVLANILIVNNINGEFSFDKQMGCGMGVCLGCMIDTHDGPKRVCKDGPVFNYRRIEWK